MDEVNNTFEIEEDFYLKGERVKIISGAIHYFRIVPEYWRDRLEKLRGMGCNTVETYVPWNMHEPVKGKLNFARMLDVGAFIKLAQELGLWVIVRPSPYICAEWEYGGLPAWLLAEEGMKVRSSYKPFLEHVEQYYRELFKILSPLQINNGGPVIMMQIENEYGYYGNDKKYLQSLKDMMRRYGAVVPFVTSDGTWGEALEAGSFNNGEVLATANFGSKAEEHFEALGRKNPDKPFMCMEFWNGWFDAWGAKEHHRRDVKEVADELDKILQKGHVNFYMFHGGTSFGFMNGANYYDRLVPDVTSYDYDAPVTEWGDITEKYEAFKEVIKKYTTVPEFALSEKIPKIAFGKLGIKEKTDLFSTLDHISVPVYSDYTLPMEKLGQNYGYILYRSSMGCGRQVESFRLLGTGDRAKVYVNEREAFTQYDLELGKPVEVNLDKPEDNIVNILVENMGRVNFGERLNYQRKGIQEGVMLDKHFHAGWEHYNLPLDNIGKVNFKAGYKPKLPAFYRFEFQAKELGDTFLRLDGWGKGCAFINGFNLGRFWEIGPQKTLYIPGPLLKPGLNEIIVFETEGKTQEFITLTDEPEIG